MKKLLYLIMLVLAFSPTSLAFGEGSTKKPIPLNPDNYPAVYRFWSETYKGHFYTADATEAANVDANYPDNVWAPEGTVFYSFAPLICETESPPPGVCLPVYRFWSSTYKHHFYTISDTEKNNIMMNMPEWSYEGIVYAANNVSFGYGNAPLYRFWSSRYKSHFYTRSESEKSNIMLNMPEWSYEGVAFYVLPYNPAL